VPVSAAGEKNESHGAERGKTQSFYSSRGKGTALKTVKEEIKQYRRKMGGGVGGGGGGGGKRLLSV